MAKKVVNRDSDCRFIQDLLEIYSGVGQHAPDVVREKKDFVWLL